MNRKEKSAYRSPELEWNEVAIEAGFADSLEGDILNPDYDNSYEDDNDFWG